MAQVRYRLHVELECGGGVARYDLPVHETGNVGCFGRILDQVQADLAAALTHAKANPLPAGARVLRELHSTPEGNSMWRDLATPEDVMLADEHRRQRYGKEGD